MLKDLARRPIAERLHAAGAQTVGIGQELVKGLIVQLAAGFDLAVFTDISGSSYLLNGIAPGSSARGLDARVQKDDDATPNDVKRLLRRWPRDDCGEALGARSL